MDGVGNRPSDGVQRGSDFTSRLADQFFRRWFLFLLPIALFAAAGLAAAVSIDDEYSSTGVLNAASNPLVAEPEARGVDLLPFESPAAGAARLMNEQLGTDAFVDDVAERSGLSAAIDAQLITRNEIRSRVSASERGENIFAVTGTWTDPETARVLVDATVAAYLAYFVDTLAADSEEAVTYWSELQATAQERVADAEDDLASYLESLPPLDSGEDRPIEVSVTIERLNSTLDRALTSAGTAQDGIDTAELNRTQARSAAERALRLVDAPQAAVAPTTGTITRGIRALSIAMVGILLAIGALIATTLMDRTVRSRQQLSDVTGAPITVTVPKLRRSDRSRAA